ncbi:MAG: hypothetical protein KC466_08470 [Myxococcales bacterium]|nr:hypothetical protein [Myxococcales bacterium]
MNVKRRAWVAMLAAAALVGCGSRSSGGRGTREEPLPSRDWTRIEDLAEVPALHSQGIASVPDLGPDEIVFSSRLTIDRARAGVVEVLQLAFTQEILDAGFDHLGDPDAHGTRVFGPLEDLSDPTIEPFRRAFAVYDADTLEVLGWSLNPGAPDRGGDGDAAWVAVSPDGRWLVTSEWSPQEDLIVFDALAIGRDATVEPAARIPLDRPLARIQGCDFDGPRVLLCASDDADTGKLVHAIVLDRALAGAAVPTGLRGTVEDLFAVPLPAPQCPFEAEVEGVDVDGDRFSVLVIGTCLVDGHRYVFGRDADSVVSR